MSKKIMIGFMVLLIIILAAQFAPASNDDLTEKVLRLHVIANSDSPADQQLKLKIKDRVIQEMRAELVAVQDAETARRVAINNIPRIKEAAGEIISAQGYNYPVEVEVGQSEFPTKSYGNLVFPQGQYQAVKVIIGEGRGKNWWCVLFPPLCMVSSSDKGISMDSPQEARVSLKCLKLLPKGLQLNLSSKENNSKE